MAFFASAMAQSGVALSGHFGSMVAHRPEIRNLLTGHAWGLEGNLYWNACGNAQWHHYYNLPQRGIDVHFTDLGNPEQLGQQYSISPYIRLQLNSTSRKLNQFLKLGMGVGYTTKTWDLETNVKGLVIGSSFNAAIHIQYVLEGEINEKMRWNTGLRIMHFSNGSFQLPNLGTNNLTLFAGLQMGKPTPKLKMEDYNWEEGNEMILGKYQAVSYEVGFRENFPPGGPKHAVHTVRYQFRKKFSNKSSWMAIADASYNRSLKPLLVRDQVFEGNEDLFQFGLAGGYGLHFGRTSFDMMMGVYLVNEYSDRGPLYHRFGLTHQLKRNWYGTMMLKTHFAKADHLAIGIQRYL